MSHAPSLSKRKSKRKENKINIKSEKLNKRKEKLSVSKVFHNIGCMEWGLLFCITSWIA